MEVEWMTDSHASLTSIACVEGSVPAADVYHSDLRFEACHVHEWLRWVYNMCGWMGQCVLLLNS